jgi:pyocin large subunit-like protein
VSIDAYRWAKEQDGLSSNRKFVLLMVADFYSEDDHRAWPSMQTLARLTGMSRRTVIRCIDQLEDCGLIEVEPWINADTGKQMSNRYYMPQYDPWSRAADQLPVYAYAGFNNEGHMQYDV